MMSQTDPLTKADYKALAGFRRTLRQFLRFSEDSARQAGVTPQQHQLLLVIKGLPNRDWATIGELAEALQILHHGAGGLVDRCVKQGLVERTHETADRRQVSVRLTERGEEILAGISERNRSELEALRQALNLPFIQKG